MLSMWVPNIPWNIIIFIRKPHGLGVRLFWDKTMYNMDIDDYLVCLLEPMVYYWFIGLNW